MTPTMLCFSDCHKRIRFINLNNVESILFDDANPNKIHMTVRFTGSTLEEDLRPEAAQKVKNALGTFVTI